MGPQRRGEQGYSRYETDRQLKTLKKEKADEYHPAQMVGHSNPRRERIEIGLLEYKVQRTTACAATTPTVSRVFYLSHIRYKKFMQTWLHCYITHVNFVAS